MLPLNNHTITVEVFDPEILLVHNGFVKLVSDVIGDKSYIQNLCLRFVIEDNFQPDLLEHETTFDQVTDTR